MHALHHQAARGRGCSRRPVGGLEADGVWPQWVRSPAAKMAAHADTTLALTLSARQTSDFELLANGGFAPLQGFMGSEDWGSVCEEMRLATKPDEIWSIPITLASDLDAAVGDVVELSAPNGKRLGLLRVEEVFERDVDKE